MGLAEGNRRAARRRRRRRRRQVARSRAGAGPGHGRLRAALRVVAALLRTGEAAPPAPAVPPAPRACCTCCAPRHPCPRRCARAKRARASHTRVRPQPRRCLRHLYLGDDPRGPAPHETLLGGDRHPQWCQRGAWTKPGRHFSLLEMGKLRPGNKMKDWQVGKGWEI